MYKTNSKRGEYFLERSGVISAKDILNDCLETINRESEEIIQELKYRGTEILLDEIQDDIESEELGNVIEDEVIESYAMSIFNDALQINGVEYLEQSDKEIILKATENELIKLVMKDSNIKFGGEIVLSMDEYKMIVPFVDKQTGDISNDGIKRILLLKKLDKMI
ncbi:hypothetical protein JK636_18605 [Clostridium sp. YIM B02515]|uniref:Uncharacterized protein n=1 Tax=Clostridium rhizosphaerae TaxID=2803861 RepID=A0ABS1TEQ2_9CLOT|nr:hypothetical protein [Clostridium rhizosphaerae]MBL4937721.1 hypothetical protein [Clostridium rhizosphaerae]